LQQEPEVLVQELIAGLDGWMVERWQHHYDQESLSGGALDAARRGHHAGDRLGPARRPNHPHRKGR
jgi:hypothetical protein